MGVFVVLVKGLEVGVVAANCYLLICPDTRQAVLMDPGDEPSRILGLVEQEKVQVVHIINTHGHVDHIGANKAVKEATAASILIHELDAPALIDPRRSLSLYTGGREAGPPADRLLQEGDTIQVGSITLHVLHTPGHTPGGISLYEPTAEVVFTGDTLFAGSIGRTDFPGGSYQEIIRSIKEKLLVLPPATIVYPGHGPSTRIEIEAQTNPFLL